MTVEAKQTNRVETDAETNTPPTGNIALAVNITKFNASAQTNIGAGFTTSGTADVRATNKTETLKVRAKTTVGDYGIQMKIMDFGSNLAFGKVADSLAGVFGTSAGGSATTSKFQLGGAAAYVKNAQSATVTIEPNVKLESTGKFTVEAKSDLADHHYEAVTKQVIDNEQGNAEKDKQGALAILINETGDGASSLASVTVGDGASITTRSSGDLTLSSEALINKDRFKFLKQELIDCFNAYADHFTADAYKDELAAFTAAKYKMVEAFDAVGQAENFTTGITQLQTAFEEFSRTLKDLMSLVGEGAGTASDFIDFGMSVLDFLNPGRATPTPLFRQAARRTRRRPIIPSPWRVRSRCSIRRRRAQLKSAQGRPSSRPKPLGSRRRAAMKASLWADSSTTSWAYRFRTSTKANPSALRWCITSSAPTTSSS